MQSEHLGGSAHDDRRVGVHGGMVGAVREVAAMTWISSAHSKPSVYGRLYLVSFGATPGSMVAVAIWSGTWTLIVPYSTMAKCWNVPDLYTSASVAASAITHWIAIPELPNSVIFRGGDD